MHRASTIFTGLMFSVVAASVPAAQSEDPLFQIHGQYERITPPQPTQSPDKVEVLELFWYGCPHCYTLEPYLQRWVKGKPDHATFRRMPAIFSERWIPHAQAYFAAEALGVLEEIHDPLFAAMHREKRPINSKDQLKAFFKEQGVSEEDFLRTYSSFAVRSKVRQAMVMTNRYGISGVPAIIVNGKYRTSGTLAGSFQSLMKVIDVLVDEEHKAITAASSTKDEAS